MPEMAGARCSCGFTEAAGADETLTDHLLEVFAAEDGTAADGRVHLEGEVSLFCMCGAGGSVEKAVTPAARPAGCSG
jgi:hypothetical protein